MKSFFFSLRKVALLRPPECRLDDFLCFFPFSLKHSQHILNLGKIDAESKYI